MEPAAPKTRRARTKLHNRQVILDAARRVFAEIGFGAATVRDIVRATPLAAGTFYNYFKSKEEVYQAIRDDIARAIRPPLHQARAAAATAEEFLAVSFRTFFAFVVQSRTDFRHLRTGAVRLTTGAAGEIAGFEELRADLEDAIARGLLPRVDADYLMAAIVGVGFEVSERMLLRPDPDPDEAALFATRLFLGGMDRLPVRQAD